MNVGPGRAGGFPGSSTGGGAGSGGVVPSPPSRTPTGGGGSGSAGVEGADGRRATTLGSGATSGATSGGRGFAAGAGSAGGGASRGLSRRARTSTRKASAAAPAIQGPKPPGPPFRCRGRRGVGVSPSTAARTRSRRSRGGSAGIAAQSGLLATREVDEPPAALARGDVAREIRIAVRGSLGEASQARRVGTGRLHGTSPEPDPRTSRARRLARRSRARSARILAALTESPSTCATSS